MTGLTWQWCRIWFTVVCAPLAETLIASENVSHSRWDETIFTAFPLLAMIWYQFRRDHNFQSTSKSNKFAGKIYKTFCRLNQSKWSIRWKNVDCLFGGQREPSRLPLSLWLRLSSKTLGCCEANTRSRKMKSCRRIPNEKWKTNVVKVFTSSVKI